jgi:(p)ppGpp synthase/HD superfamily hydrolase
MMNWQRQRALKAIRIAGDVHDGLLDKGGKPMFDHVNRVAMGAGEMGTDEFIVGLLHDTVEDGDVTVDQLRAEFGDKIADAVEALTHLDNEPYWDYIARVELNELAIAVKLSDLTDNMDLQRTLLITDTKDYDRVVQVLVPRYYRAYARLMVVQEHGYNHYRV